MRLRIRRQGVGEEGRRDFGEFCGRRFLFFSFEVGLDRILIGFALGSMTEPLEDLCEKTKEC